MKVFSDILTLMLEAEGDGGFEYSIDGANFQDDGDFEISPGIYTIHVRDKLLCGTISQEIIALGYLKFFTPNGDGANDSWKVIGSEQYPNSALYIFDRYGKIYPAGICDK